MAREQESDITFALLVSIFLGLIVKNGLDIGLRTCLGGKLTFVTVLLLSSLVVVLTHSFRVFLSVHSDTTYRDMLARGRRPIVRWFFVCMIGVFVVMYAMSELYTSGAEVFIAAVGILSIGWAVLDFMTRAVVASFYQAGSIAAEEDPLRVACERWLPCDFLLAGLSVILIISMRAKVMTEVEAAIAIFGAVCFIAWFVENALRDAGVRRGPGPAGAVEGDGAGVSGG
jgi:hypothetical protein